MRFLQNGATANDGTGTNLRDAADALNLNARILQYRGGGLRKLKIATAGNSFIGYGALSNWGAYLAVARMLHFDADVLIDTRAYYENVTAAERGSGTDYPRYPEGQRGMNFGAGGRDTVQMLDFQLPYILEAIAAGKMHPVLWVDPWANDKYFAVGAAKATVDRVIAFCEAILPHGIEIVMMGDAPRNGVGAATENAYGKHYTEARMRNWCDKTPGMHFIPVLDLLKRGDPAEEAQGLIQWKGTKGDIGGATNDDIHYSCYGARLVAKRVADVMRTLVAEFVPPCFEAMDYDEARNPYANYFGSAGRLIGTGGKVNGVANANVPTGWDLIYDTTKGVTITPTLTGDPAWPLRLTFDGTPTADVQWALRTTSTKQRLTAQSWEIWGMARWVNARNVAGIALGDGRLGTTGADIIVPLNGSGSFGGRGHVMPDALTETIKFRGPTSTMGAGSTMVRFDFQGAFVSGLPVSGALEIARAGLFRTDNIL